jgi:hypothetical protein
MKARALFTTSDLATVGRAAVLAEKLTRDYFQLPEREWERNPYSVFTCREVHEDLRRDDVFAHLVSLAASPARDSGRSRTDRFGIVLEDPNILRALFRRYLHDLWTLLLFILTHELVHIIRFRRSEADFFASEQDCRNEEAVVEELTRRILTGVANTDRLLSLYHSRD